MSETIGDALARARSDVQELHKRIDIDAGKNQEEVRDEMRTASMKAHDLAVSLRALAAGRAGSARAQLEDAAARLEAAASEARAASEAADAAALQAHKTTLANVRDAARSLSDALASHRSAALQRTVDTTHHD
jgi:hypothetical protein